VGRKLKQVGLPYKLINKNMPRAKKEAITEDEEVLQVVELESILLDTPAKQAYSQVLDVYKKQNPIKFEQKKAAFTKKMLSL